MELYEVKPGYWIAQGVTWEEHQAAVASNYNPGEDEYFEQEFERELRRALKRDVFRRARAQDESRIWRTRDGEEIPYADLDDGHLSNIMAFLERRNWKVAHHWPNLHAEARTRGLA